MTSSAFIAARRAIGWSNRQIALALKCSPDIVHRWSVGRATIPPSVAKWLSTLAAFHERHPAPTNWRVRK